MTGDSFLAPISRPGNVAHWFPGPQRLGRAVDGGAGAPSDLSTGGRLGGPRAEDFDRPSSARVYDYLLGGATHGAVDRQFADRLAAAEPTIISIARENRSFLRRAVRFLVEAGVEQFLDLGSGVPTMGNVHEVVARSGSTARVAYVDVDPVAVAHARHLLGSTPSTTFTEADVTDVDAVVGAESVREMIDFSRPVGLLMFSVLQHVPGEAAPLVEGYLSRLAPGSALAVSHLTADDARTAVPAIEVLTESYSRTFPRGRTHAEVEELCAGVDLVDPGVAWTTQWRPDPGRPPGEGATGAHWGAVGFRR